MNYPARLLFFLAVALLVATSGLYGQDEPPEAPPDQGNPLDRELRRRQLLEGTHVLRRILHEEKFTALNDIDAIHENPSRTLLVVLGNLNVLDRLSNQQDLAAFVRAGGAVLLASDRQLTNQRALAQLNSVASVHIGAQEDNFQPGACYKGIPFCPYVWPVANAEPDLFGSADGNSSTVATNTPATLLVRPRLRPSPLRPIGVLPGSNAPFAVAGELGKGRVLVMGDHSVFINEMMMPNDNGNAEFANRAIGWLAGEEDSRRDQVLFVEEGGIQTKLEIPLKSIRPPIEEILRLIVERRNEIASAGNDLLIRMEEEDTLNRGVIDTLFRFGLYPGRLAAIVGSIVTFLLALFAIYRVGIRNRFRYDTSVPVLTSEIERRLPLVPLHEQRWRALLRSSNLAEPALFLTRAWWTRLGVSQFTGPVPVSVSGSWWQRRRLTSRLDALWRLATGQVSRVRGSAVRSIEREVVALEDALQRGQWRLVSALDAKTAVASARDERHG